MIKNENDEKKRKFTVNDSNSLFEDELNWLETELKKSKDNNEMVIVLTRKIINLIIDHTPILNKTSEPKYKDSDINSAFSTDLEYLIEKYDNIKAWCCGKFLYKT
jgi:hypothetical protein